MHDAHACVPARLPPMLLRGGGNVRQGCVQVNVRLVSPAFMERPELVLLLCQLWRSAASPLASAAHAVGLSVEFTNLADGGPQGDPGQLCPASGVALKFNGWAGSLPAFVGDVFAALAELCGRLDTAEEAADLSDAVLVAAGYGGQAQLRREGAAEAGTTSSDGDGRAAGSVGEGGGAAGLGGECARREEGAQAAEVRPLLRAAVHRCRKRAVCNQRSGA